LVTRTVKSAFGVKHVENNWTDDDWGNYQFNLNLMNSVRNKAVMEHRKLNQDEFKFLAEMEERNEALRQKYKSGDPK
jgi:hypothetical protein